MSIDNIHISIHLDETSSNNVQGRLIDISSRGFLCEFSLDNLIENSIKSGQAINYRLNNNLGLDSIGEIRHVIKKSALNGTRCFKSVLKQGSSDRILSLKNLMIQNGRKKRYTRKVFRPL
jgi:hypothetical protein